MHVGTAQPSVGVDGELHEHAAAVAAAAVAAVIVAAVVHAAVHAAVHVIDNTVVG